MLGLKIKFYSVYMPLDLLWLCDNSYCWQSTLLVGYC